MPRERPQVNQSIGKLIIEHKSSQSAPRSTGAAAAALRTSNLVDSTQSTSNSVAASEAYHRAHKCLQRALKLYKVSEDDFAYSALATKGGHHPPDALLLDYIGRIEQYRNHRLPDSLPAYPLSHLQWQKVCLAAKAAKEVHKMKQSSEDALFIPGSTDGTIKPFAVFRHTHDEARALVIAIRGSRTMWDWMVNFNSEATECKELGLDLVCHKGFLSIAQNMKSSIEQRIADSTATPLRATNIIFTGHSSGAAVAQLLFGLIRPGNFLRLSPNGCQIDCITFGGSPMTFPPIVLPPSASMFLNFKNEGDPVTLAQPSYIESFLEAYVLKPRGTDPVWTVPDPFFYSSGDQVVLRNSAADDAEAEDPSSFSVSNDQMHSVIFGNPVLHRMTLYLRRVESLRDRSASQASSTIFT